MAARGFNPLRLDVEVFAKEAAALEGRWPLRQFERLTDSTPAEARPGAADEVVWSVRGERRQKGRGEPQTWLHLKTEARLAIECQRCLRPVELTLRVDRGFMFVAGEDAAARIDADSEDDVLTLSRALDLRKLIEDELLLAMPLVPRHGVCPEPLEFTPEDKVEAEGEPHPFAALAALKQGGSAA